jgi:4'-phosphopantetheinyl transferase
VRACDTSFAPSAPEAVRSFAGGIVEAVSVRLDAGRVAVLSRCLCDAERRRADRFVFERDRRRFIVGRARLRQLLGARLDVAPETIELVYGPYGKPGLSRRFADSDLRFNVSHAEDVAIYAFTRGLEVGVDIERVRELPDADDIAARFFSRRENEAYLALGPRDKPMGFFNCWTRKEAFIKALGEGLSHPLEQFDVSLAPGAPAEILRIGDARGHDGGWRMESFSPAVDFVAAVVTEQPLPRAPSN